MTKIRATEIRATEIKATEILKITASSNGAIFDYFDKRNELTDNECPLLGHLKFPKAPCPNCGSVALFRVQWSAIQTRDQTTTCSFVGWQGFVRFVSANFHFWVSFVRFVQRRQSLHCTGDVTFRERRDLRLRTHSQCGWILRARLQHHPHTWLFCWHCERWFWSFKHDECHFTANCSWDDSILWSEPFVTWGSCKILQNKLFVFLVAFWNSSQCRTRLWTHLWTHENHQNKLVKQGSDGAQWTEPKITFSKRKWKWGSEFGCSWRRSRALPSDLSPAFQEDTNSGCFVWKENFTLGLEVQDERKMKRFSRCGDVVTTGCLCRKHWSMETAVPESAVSANLCRSSFVCRVHKRDSQGGSTKAFYVLGVKLISWVLSNFCVA